MTNKIGALWSKVSQKGERFMSGMIEVEGKKINVVVFKNSKKDQDKHPDYNILLSQPRTEPRPEPQPEKEIPIEETPF